MSNEQLKVGGHLWMFDENHRVYDTDKSGPNFEKHFIRCRIVDETPRSWIVTQYDNIEYKRSPHMFHKVSKKDFSACKWNGTRQRFFTDEMKADRLWEHEHKWRIIEELRFSSTKIDTAMMQKIAQIIGYDTVTKTIQ